MADVPAIAATVGAVGGPAVAAIALLVNARTTRLQLEQQERARRDQLEQDLTKLRQERLQDVQIGLYQRLAAVVAKTQERAYYELRAIEDASPYDRNALAEELKATSALAELVAAEPVIEALQSLHAEFVSVPAEGDLKRRTEHAEFLWHECGRVQRLLRDAVHELGT